jgi:hypothetical protein
MSNMLLLPFPTHGRFRVAPLLQLLLLAATCGPRLGSSAAPRVAVCLVGQARSYVNDAARAQLHAAVLEPLEPHADLFVRLDLGEHGVDRLTPLFSNNARIKALAFESRKPPAREENGCLTQGRAMFDKWRACFADVLAYEVSHPDVTYDFVVRVRPDMVASITLPRIACWEGLRDDVVWDHYPLYDMPPQSMSTTLLQPAARAEFVSDWLSLTSRRLAHVIFNVSDDLDACVSPTAPEPDPCHGRWGWVECRPLLRIKREAGAHVGTLLKTAPTTAHWRFAYGGAADLARCLDTDCGHIKLGQSGEESLAFPVTRGTFLEVDYKSPDIARKSMPKCI